MSDRLGKKLIEKNLLTTEQLDTALAYQKEHGGVLGSILVKLNLVSEGEVARVLGEQYGVPFVELDDFEFDREVIKLIPMEMAIRHHVVPMKKSGSTLTVATTDPTNLVALDLIKFMTGYHIEAVVTSDSSIDGAIKKHYGTEQTIALQQVYDQLEQEGEEYELDISTQEGQVDLSELKEASSEAPIIKLVNIILAEAIQQGTSDIHLEPYEGKFRVRYRIDGELYDVMTPPLKLRDAVISRVKIMANLDISERRVPQDGRIKIRLSHLGRSRQLDFRVSTLPILFGEKVVLRILDQEKLPLDLDQLGFEPEERVKMESAIASPYGMVLVTGPTGSGKTSTLYTALKKLNKSNVNIMTAEDPVEFNFEGINQVQTKEQIGLTFAAALRSFLRQDPNIIMVGEIRDLETAEIAFKAALTGHLVLSTLHTNDAPSTVSRLLDMGVEPFLVATSVNLVGAQRLVRTICSECKEKTDTPVKVLVDIGFSPEVAENVVTYRGVGCSVCNQSGYKGRIGLYEVLEISPTIETLIMKGAHTTQLRQQARREGMTTLRESGLKKIQSGKTTLDEVLRETAEEMASPLPETESPAPEAQPSVLVGEAVQESASPLPETQSPTPAPQPPVPLGEAVQEAASPLPETQSPTPATQPSVREESKSHPAVTTPLQWGVLGTTNLAVEQVISAIQNSRRGRVAAIASLHREEMEKVANKLDVGRCYDSYEQLLADSRIDAIYVALPNSLRCEWVIQAIESGKPVLCQNPIAASADECRRMIEVARQKDVFLVEASGYRHHPQHQLVREGLIQGRLGKIRVVRAQLQDPVPENGSSEKLAGSTLMDGGSSLVNLCRWFYRREPTRVSASFRMDPADGVDLSFDGELDFGDDQQGVIAGMFQNGQRTSSYGVEGDRGQLVVEPFLGSEEDSLTIRLTIDGQTSEQHFPAANNFTLQVDAFASCLKEGTPPLPPAEDALQNITVIEALYQSGQTGQQVSVLPAKD